MSNIPDDLYYAKSHEWLKDNGDGTYSVGITDHAQEALGDLVFVEAANEGAVQAGDACCVVESVKAASDIYSPISGAITETNAALEESPELINSDPYGEGWLFKMQGDAVDVTTLLDAASYANHLASEE